MKRILSVLIVISVISLVKVNAQNQIATLNHNGTTTVYPGPTGFQDAYNTAVNVPLTEGSADVIILSSGTFYPPEAITKRLKIIGAGHYTVPDTDPNINPATHPVYTATYVGNIILGTGSDNTLIEGLYINIITNTDAISYITIKRCRIDIPITFDYRYSNSNFLIESSVFPRIDFKNMDHNVVIRNNIITNTADYTSPNIVGIYSGAFIENNVISFLSSNYISVFQNVNNSTIQNNVIFSSSPNCYTIYSPGGNIGNYFYNNYVATACGDLATWNYFGSNNTFANNYTGDITTIYPIAPGTFDYNFDYHIIQNETTSAYKGIDNTTPVGIYGGSYPYKDKAIPENPRVTHKDIGTQTDGQGKLHINITSKAQTY